MTSRSQPLGPLFRSGEQLIRFEDLDPSTVQQLIAEFGKFATVNNPAVPHAMCRLSVTSGNPVTTADVTGASANTLYLEPFNGQYMPFFGSEPEVKPIGTQLSLPFDSNSGHTLYHQAARNYDVWGVDDNGRLRLVTGAQWTNDTTPADARVSTQGLILNNATMTVRYGTGASDTLSIPPRRAVLYGSVRMQANGQAEDSFARRYVSNYFNDQIRHMRIADLTNSWIYSTATTRQANNSAANEVDFICCTPWKAGYAQVLGMYSTNAAGAYGIVAPGFDSTTAFATGFFATVNQSETATITTFNAFGCVSNFPGLGRHRYTWLERGGGVGTVTWFGDAGSPTIFQTGLSGWIFG